MKTLFVGLAVLIFAISVPSLQAATVFSDNFNAENGGVGNLNYNGFANWTVTGGTVDLIGSGFFDFYPTQGMYVDLDGSTSQSGLFASNAIALASGSYVLQFSLGGSTRGDTNTVIVTLGSLYNESFTLNSSDPLTTITRNFSVGAPTSVALTFQNNGGDNRGLILDDVSVNTAATNVPEPASLATLFLGMAGLGFLGRKAFRS